MERPRLAGGTSRHVLPVDQDLAGGQVLQPGDEAQQRGLAAARGADEDHELAVADVEIGIGDDDRITEGLAHIA